jgi:hypothetical protein
MVSILVRDVMTRPGRTVMARPPELFVRPLSMAEGQRLQRINSTANDRVRLRRAMIVLASAQGWPVCDNLPEVIERGAITFGRHDFAGLFALPGIQIGGREVGRDAIGLRRCPHAAGGRAVDAKHMHLIVPAGMAGEVTDTGRGQPETAADTDRRHGVERDPARRPHPWHPVRCR